MCGIAAIIDHTKSKPKTQEVKAMLHLLAHRGPDGEGMLSQEGVTLGHRRLAILDTDHRSDQPMSRYDAHLVFNGLIYNYIELREELKKHGHVFRTSSDTEVILYAYAQWGIDCFQRFNGMWAMVIHDTRRNIVICSRDRFGIKPLYYTKVKEQLIIASEIKAFKAIPDWKSKVNHVRLYEYLAYNMQDHTEETMFSEVFAVPKSHHMVIDLGNMNPKIHRYYDINRPIECHRGEELFVKLADAIKIRTRSDVPLACTLSGGLDSSSIVSTMTQRLNINPMAFSLTYPDNPVDESTYARLVADQYQLDQKLVHPTQEDILAHMDEVIYTQDEPFTGMTVMAQSAIYRSARQAQYKVILGGQGGDEILCGYTKFILARVRSLLRRHPIQALKESLQYGSALSLGLWDIFKNYIDYHCRNKNKHPKWYLTASPMSSLYVRSAESSVFDMSYNLLFHLGISALLRYEDRNSMSHGIESRLPFLDYRLVEYCLSMQDDVKISKGTTKKILKETMRDIVPKAIINRKDKMGLLTPQNMWMRENSSFYESLMQQSLQYLPMIDHNMVIAQTSTDNKLMWRIINAGKWVQTFNVSI